MIGLPCLLPASRGSFSDRGFFRGHLSSSRPERPCLASLPLVSRGGFICASICHSVWFSVLLWACLQAGSTFSSFSMLVRIRGFCGNEAGNRISAARTTQDDCLNAQWKTLKAEFELREQARQALNKIWAKASPILSLPTVLLVEGRTIFEFGPSLFSRMASIKKEALPAQENVCVRRSKGHQDRDRRSPGSPGTSRRADQGGGCRQHVRPGSLRREGCTGHPGLATAVDEEYEHRAASVAEAAPSEDRGDA